jgi:hypothetical protein
MGYNCKLAGLPPWNIEKRGNLTLLSANSHHWLLCLSAMNNNSADQLPQVMKTRKCFSSRGNGMLFLIRKAWLQDEFRPLKKKAARVKTLLQLTWTGQIVCAMKAHDSCCFMTQNLGIMLQDRLNRKTISSAAHYIASITKLYASSRILLNSSIQIVRFHQDGSCPKRHTWQLFNFIFKIGYCWNLLGLSPLRQEIELPLTPSLFQY